MKKLLVVLLLFFSTNVLADSYVTTNGLTDTQKAELALQIAKMKEDAEHPPEDTVDKTLERMGKVAAMGKDIGQGLGAAAKELGIAVNDFAKTPVGIASMALIAWKVAGVAIAHVVFGSIFWIILLGVYIYMVRRWCFTTTITEVHDKDTGKLTSRVKVVGKNSFVEEGVMFWSGLFFLVINVGCAAVVFNGW